MSTLDQYKPAIARWSNHKGMANAYMSIGELMLRERIIFLGTPIDDQVSNSIVAQLLYPGQGRRAKKISRCTSIPPAG